MSRRPAFLLGSRHPLWLVVRAIYTLGLVAYGVTYVFTPGSRSFGDLCLGLAAAVALAGQAAKRTHPTKREHGHSTVLLAIHALVVLYFGFIVTMTKLTFGTKAVLVIWASHFSLRPSHY